MQELECYVDADFAGAYCKEDSDDPISVKSRTGYVIKYAGCPIAWASKLQTEIALSTTEAEYIALSQATRELIPMRLIILELADILNIPCANLKLNCTIFEDNKGAEELAKVPKHRPRTKHIAIKYHHFREWVKNGIMTITHISTDEQQADIFTKPLTLKAHEYLREKIMGWCCILITNIENQTLFENMRKFACGW